MKNAGDINQVTGTFLKIYYDAYQADPNNAWVSNDDFKAKINLLGINTDGGGHGIAKMKPALYFGLLERKKIGKDQCHRITQNGIDFYDAYNRTDEDTMVRILMDAIQHITFGRNNPAVAESDSDIEVPIVFLKASLILNGVLPKERAYILQELEAGEDFNQLLCEIQELRTYPSGTLARKVNNEWHDDKGIDFLCATGLTTTKDEKDPIKDKYKQQYAKVIKNLSIYKKVPTVITPADRQKAFVQFLDIKGSPSKQICIDIADQTVQDAINTVRNTLGNANASIYEIDDTNVVSSIMANLPNPGPQYDACEKYIDFLKVFINGKLVLSKPEQTIYYGAPGTGKSQSIKKLEQSGNLVCKRITFHPDTDYASFVGSYKPIMSENAKGDEEVKYEFQEQIFLECYYDAWNHPSKNYAIVIEEINRGNCAQIFGDIFQLLDRREDGYSDYPIVASRDIQQSMVKHLPISYASDVASLYKDSNNNSYIQDGWKMLTLPPNLSIYATMNTSDNSLYRMDSAFKRRWKWVYTKIEYSDSKLSTVQLYINGLIDKNWMRILEKINLFIKNETQSTSKQIGQWFIIPEKDSQGQFAKISFMDFRDKVMFYLFNDVFKDSDCLKNIIAPNEEVFLYEDLVMSPDDGKQMCCKFINDLLTI